MELSLTKQETELIETYRRLFPAFQEQLLSLIKSMYDVQCCTTIAVQSSKDKTSTK